MEHSPEIKLLRALVKAHETPGSDGTREPIYVFRHSGGQSLQHPALSDVPAFDETMLEDLHAGGFIDIDYRERSSRITPTQDGRRLIKQLDAVEDTEARADVTAFIEAVELQGRSSNKLAWPAVRPVLLAMRRYWEDAGFDPDGVGLVPLYAAIPDDAEPMFVATVRSLLASGYLDLAADIQFNDLPALVRFTDRAFEVLDGWPGASSQDLVENMLAVLTERAQGATDPDERRRLERWRDTVRELGVSTASEVLAKVLTGGM
ncbi:MAG TPA: hypothetical protein VF549_21050 [Solirubrobacteraceae bacterium]